MWHSQTDNKSYCWYIIGIKKLFNKRTLGFNGDEITSTQKYIQERYDLDVVRLPRLNYNNVLIMLVDFLHHFPKT